MIRSQTSPRVTTTSGSNVVLQQNTPGVVCVSVQRNSSSNSCKTIILTDVYGSSSPLSSSSFGNKTVKQF